MNETSGFENTVGRTFRLKPAAENHNSMILPVCLVFCFTFAFLLLLINSKSQKYLHENFIRRFDVYVCACMREYVYVCVCMYVSMYGLKN